ncbi:MAG: CdaR family protein [Candidatus Rokuibacteriota bacterium]
MSLAARLGEHWQLKLLSVAFAIALWMFVAAEDRGEAVYTVPLELIAVPPGLQVTSVGATTVEARVEGLQSILKRIPGRELRALVTLRDARAGEMVALVLPEDIAVPRGARVVRVSPSRIRVTLGTK